MDQYCLETKHCTSSNHFIYILCPLAVYYSDFALNNWWGASSFFLLPSLFSLPLSISSFLTLLEAERPCWQAVPSDESLLILMLWYLHYWDSDDLEICDVNRAGEGANTHIFRQTFIMWVLGIAKGTLTVPVIPAPSRSFALWLRCNQGSFGRLWKWSKQTEMDGEISSVQCPESAGCTVHLIAPSYRHRSYHERMLGPMRYGQFARFAENVSELQFLQNESLIWISTGQAWPSWSDAGATWQQANWKKVWVLYQSKHFYW